VKGIILISGDSVEQIILFHSSRVCMSSELPVMPRNDRLGVHQLRECQECCSLVDSLY